MSKPWDKLRVPMVQPPISCGSWQAIGGMRVSWEPVLCHQFLVRLNEHQALTASCGSWRELGEFLIELADQHEAT
jgi:hypothetical protein